MYQAETYMQNITKLLRECFAHRLLYVGLQGSYLRGEATDNSDIDVVVILDDLTAADLSAYKKIVSRLERPEKSCGFICGKAEMENWNPLEVCNFLHGTKDYYGTLASFLPQYSREDVVNFVKLSVGNLYHEISHRYVHADEEKNKSRLPYSYKNVFFILQSVYYLKTGTYAATKKELALLLSPEDKEMLDKAAWLPKAEKFDFEAEFAALLEWCRRILREI